MSILAALTSDLRSRASYMPYCPLCSHVGVNDLTDILRSPSLRVAKSKEGPRHKITQCCSLSSTSQAFETPSDAASWWRARRLETQPDIATDNRRKSTLTKLEAKGFEPL